MVSVTAQEAGIRECAVVQSATVNLRAGPGTDTEVLGKVHEGDEYEIVRTAENWIKIRHWDLGDGWLYRPLVAVYAETTMVAATPLAETQGTGERVAASHSRMSGAWLVPAVLAFLGLLLVLGIHSIARPDEHRLLHHQV